MNYKLRSFVACLLCFFQCVMLFSSDILAATSEGGDISSSFRIDKTEFVITVVDCYYDEDYNSTEVIREEKTYALGESYSYDALKPDGYILERGFQSNVSGVASSDLEIYFYYEKITDVRITVSFDEALCNYLNKYGANVSPTDIVWKIGNDSGCDSWQEITLGEESSVDFSFQDIAETHIRDYSDSDENGDIYDEDGFLITDLDNDNCLIRAVRAYRTYYYEYGKGWNPQPHYLGSPVDGLMEDEYISRVYDEDYGLIYKCNFPEDLGVDTDTMSCCHIVLCMDDIYRSGYKSVKGIYRTAIDGVDAEDDIESWYDYSYSDGTTIRVPYSGIKDSWEWENEPEVFTYIENGTRIREWTRLLIYHGLGNDEGSYLVSGKEFVMDSAPHIEGYKCINPDAPREFISQNPNEEFAGLCFYYDYVPVVTHKIVIKDKFIDESGNEIEIQERQTDNVPEDEEYTYEALDPIPDGYKLVSDPTVTDTSTEDKEIVFVYQRIPQYIITVKDKFIDESGVEERTDTRKEDKVPEDEEYTYEALDPIPDGYKLVSDPTVTDTSTEDKEIVFIYQKIPSYNITVKDKFIDESGVEERTDIREEDKVPEGEEYTYKALDPIPEGYKLVSNLTVTDTSTEDKEIVFIYQKLHQYTITVKDKFTSESGVEENTAIRKEDKLYEDSSYHYSALSPVPEGYELVGSSDYAGKADKDMEIIFTYRKKIVLPNTYSMVVKDKYIDVDGSVIRIDERVNTALKAFEEYSFTAIDPVPEGYEVVGASGYVGKITSDTEIIFVYQKKPAEKPATYSFKVVDEFYDADGNVIKTVERTTDTLEEGSEYVCTALKPVPDGYVLISDNEYRGIISGDTVIVFKYKDASVRLVTVKGYLTYKNGEPVANKKVEIHSEVRTAITDADGYYEIRNIEAGNHKYTVFNDDGTDLITCDLNIAKSGQDTAEVTYKMRDVEVSIDLSVADVLEIDGVLPLYNLKVFDKFYDENNRLVKSELRKSLTAVNAGTAYSYDALSIEGYTLTSEKNYSGVVLGDTEVIFTYKKDKKPDKPTQKPTPDPKPDPSPEKKNYKVTVVDNYYDANALLISSTVRLTELKTEGDAYYYEAKLVSNFTLIGADHYSDFVHSDLTLAFAYKAVATPKDAVITVIDRFIDEDGNPEDEIRITDDKKVGDPYQYDAIPKEGYEIVGSSSYTGVVTSHLTLIFTYQKISEDKQAANEYTVTVIDKFITDISVNQFIIDESEKTGVSDGLNKFNTYQYAREDGQYIYMVRRTVRCKDTYTEGSSYMYKALELKNFACISETEFSGVITDNVELEFVYARKGLALQDIPDNVYNSRPDFPDSPEAKTGDLDEADSKVDRIPYVMIVILFMAVILAAWAGRKRYYR